MYRKTSAPKLVRFPFFLAFFLTLVTFGLPVDTVGQELPNTPAAKQLVALLECINLEQAKDRTSFLEGQFADEGDLQTSMEQRMEITESLHERFAPLSISEVLKSGKLRIVVNCKTSQEVLLNIDLHVSESEGNPITDIGMEPVVSKEEESVPDGMVRLFGDDGKTALEARGVWLAQGYGYVFEVLDDSFQMYNLTESFAWKQEFDETLFFKSGQNSSGAVVTMHVLEPGYRLTRLDSLPAQCTAIAKWNSLQVFDAFTQVFKEHYPFFDVRNVDWEERIRRIRPTLNDSSTEEQLFIAMESMLKDLGDGHVYLNAEIDGQKCRIRSNRTNTLKRLRESFRPSEEFRSFQAFFGDWKRRFKDSVVKQTLQGEGKVVGNRQIVWGRAHDRIGYVGIYGMGGYSYGNTDSQIDALHDALNEILSKLADTEALIVDVSFNGGGADLFSLEIASHFTSEKRLGFSKWPIGVEQYRQDRFVVSHREKNKNGVMYTKPIYLVTNEVTASAAEIFTMCMRSIPNVTTVGLRGEGALSDVLSKTLPNGWELGLSNEIYVDHEGKCHEGRGIPVDIEMAIFDHGNISKIGHAESMQKIVKLILKGLSDAKDR